MLFLWKQSQRIRHWSFFWDLFEYNVWIFAQNLSQSSNGRCWIFWFCIQDACSGIFQWLLHFIFCKLNMLSRIVVKGEMCSQRARGAQLGNYGAFRLYPFRIHLGFRIFVGKTIRKLDIFIIRSLNYNLSWSWLTFQILSNLDQAK